MVKNVENMLHRKKTTGFWFIGLSGSGKSESSKVAYSYLRQQGYSPFLIDGDEVRKYISTDLGYSQEERVIQVLRIAGLAKICHDQGYVPICSSVYMSEDLALKIKQMISLNIVAIKRDMTEVIKSHPTYQNYEHIVGQDIQVNYAFDGVKLIQNHFTKEHLQRDIIQHISDCI